MAQFHNVYILTSIRHPARHYTGLTRNLEQRVREHNSGKVGHTAKYRPWRIDTAIAFRNHEKAGRFERYLKTHSGRAFAKRHF